MKLNKLLFVKVALFALLALSLVMLATSIIHAVTTGTIYDGARSTAAVTKGVFTIVFVAIGLIAAVVGVIYAYKGWEIIGLILVLVAIVALTVAFIIPLKDQYDTKKELGAYDDMLKMNGGKLDMTTHIDSVGVIMADKAIVAKGALQSDEVKQQVEAFIKAGIAKSGNPASSIDALYNVLGSIKQGPNELIALTEKIYNLDIDKILPILNGDSQAITGVGADASNQVTNIDNVKALMNQVNVSAFKDINEMMSNHTIIAKTHLYSINLAFFASLVGLATINGIGYLVVK